jgi:hypothetical protein
MEARNSALPPLKVPVSTITSGLVSQTISWKTQRSSGFLTAVAPSQRVRPPTPDS